MIEYKSQRNITMYKENCNIYDEESGIDKYEGTFEKEESDCTIFVNETVNMIICLESGGLYMYLLCRPKKWKFNAKHLASIFNCNKEKIYKQIDYLISLKLLTRTTVRNKGKFVRYHYSIHLRPKINQVALIPG